MQKQYREYKEIFSNQFYVVHNYSLVPNRNLHCHDEFEITLICSEESDIHCINNGKKISLSKNSLIFFHNLDLHMLYKSNPAPCDRCTIHFLPEIVMPYCTNMTNLLQVFYIRLSSTNASNVLQLTDQQVEKYLKLFDELDFYRNHTLKGTYGTDVHSIVLLVRILLMLNSLYFDVHGKEPITSCSCSGEKYMLLCNILDYIHENYVGELSLEILSKKFYISRSQINTLFRNIMGLTPSQYISEYRLRQAKELLIQNTPVETVCFECGYKNPSHFSHTFKQHEGMSPKQYQTAMQTQKDSL